MGGGTRAWIINNLNLQLTLLIVVLTMSVWSDAAIITPRDASEPRAGMFGGHRRALKMVFENPISSGNGEFPQMMRSRGDGSEQEKLAAFQARFAGKASGAGSMERSVDDMWAKWKSNVRTGAEKDLPRLWDDNKKEMAFRGSDEITMV